MLHVCVFGDKFWPFVSQMNQISSVTAIALLRFIGFNRPIWLTLQNDQDASLSDLLTVL